MNVGQLAQLDQIWAEANHWLDHLLDAVREHRVDNTDCPHPSCYGDHANHIIEQAVQHGVDSVCGMLAAAVHRLLETEKP